MQQIEGIFLKLLTLMAKYDSNLYNHLQSSRRNEMYTSPQIQKDFIDVLAKFTEQSILAEVQEASFYSIMSDSTQDSVRTIWIDSMQEARVGV